MGEMADNSLECSVVLEKTRFDARETFPDFKLVFANKGEKTCIFSTTFIPSRNMGLISASKYGERKAGRDLGK